MAILIFILILLALILVHEFGHFAAAKWFGIKVEEFGVGFPPKLWGKKYGETEYTVNALPFGGFVRIFGENKEEQQDEAVVADVNDAHRTFSSKSRWIQALVLVAGVGMNIVAAWLILSVGYMVGLPAASEDARFGTVTESQVTILEVAPNSPAAEAGLLAGEKLVGIKAQTGSFLERDALSDDVRHFITQHSGEELTFTLSRGEQEREVTMTPKEGIVEGKPVVGVVLDDVGILRLLPHTALLAGAYLTYDLTIATAVGLWDFFSGIFTGAADFSSVAGPVGIVGVVDEASQFGLTSLLLLTAVISINLAIINLIPFPALDGGRLFMVALEGVTRRTIPPRVFGILNAAGFVLLIALMIAVTYNDILRLF